MNKYLKVLLILFIMSFAVKATSHFINKLENENNKITESAESNEALNELFKNSETHVDQNNNEIYEINGGENPINNKKLRLPILSFEELKNCVIKEKKIEKLSEKSKEKEKILSEENKKVDIYNQVSVDNYNKLVSQYKVGNIELNSLIDSFNLSCTNRAYYKNDMIKALTLIGEY
jgi:hypothetical protein